MTPLDIALVAIIAALLLILDAALRTLIKERARAEREWVAERTRLLNAALHPEVMIPPSVARNQQLEIVPDPDASEMNKVGQVIPITDGNKSKDE